MTMHRIGFYPKAGAADLVPPQTSLWGWWMGSEAYTETSGTPTTKQTTNLGAIGSLKDMSGNGRHFYQATGSAKPAYIAASVFNSLPGFRIASGDSMDTNAQVIPSTAPCHFSLYCVLRPTGWNGNAGLFCTPNDSSIIQAGWTTGTTDEYTARYGNDSGSQRNILKWAQGANHLIHMSQALSSIIYHTDNGLGGVNGYPTAPSTSGGSGSSQRLGRFAGNGYFIGDIAELLVYTAYHRDGSGGDGFLAKQYLDWKYNLGLGYQDDGFPYITGSYYGTYSGSPITMLLPTDIVVNDVLFAAIARDATTSTTWPAGWTELHDTSSGSNALSAAWRRCDGTEGASISVTQSSSGPGRYQVLKIKGAATSGTPIEAGTAVAASSSSGNPPSLTASWGALKNLFIVACAHDTNVAVTVWPTGYDLHRLDGQGFGSAQIATCAKKAAVATDDPSVITFAASADNKTNTFVVKPA